MGESAWRLVVTFQFVHVRTLEDIDTAFRKPEERRVQALPMTLTIVLSVMHDTRWRPHAL